MNLYNGLNKITEYIEMHIDEEISMSTLARLLGCSIYTMERIFSMLVGFTIKEYIKRRRFTLAIKKLMDGEKIIDVSLFCGYSNPTSFSRKFYDIYKIHPKDLRMKKINFILQPILTFEEKNYNDSITYRIEVTKEKTFYGKKTQIEKDIPKEAEKFWEEMKLKYPQILLNFPRYAVLEEGLKNYYWILLNENDKDLEKFIMPKGKWLVFKGNSFKGVDISSLSKKIYSEYLKSLSFSDKGSYTLELYYEDYIEIWIPIN